MQVMEGMQEGTLFDRDVVEAEENASRCTSTAASEDGDALETVRDLALAARTASRKLAACPTEVTLPPTQTLAGCQDPCRAMHACMQALLEDALL